MDAPGLLSLRSERVHGCPVPMSVQARGRAQVCGLIAQNVHSRTFERWFVASMTFSGIKTLIGARSEPMILTVTLNPGPDVTYSVPTARPGAVDSSYISVAGKTRRTVVVREGTEATGRSTPTRSSSQLFERRRP